MSPSGMQCRGHAVKRLDEEDWHLICYYTEWLTRLMQLSATWSRLLRRWLFSNIVNAAIMKWSRSIKLGPKRHCLMAIQALVSSDRTGMSADLSAEKHVWACKSDLSNRHTALKWALLWSLIRISSRSGWDVLIYAGLTSLRLSRCSSVTGPFMKYRPGNGKMLCQVFMIRTALCKAHKVMQSISGPK